MNSIKIDNHLQHYHSMIDPEDNLASSPPLTEQIRMPCIWVVEVFPPSFIASLKLSIEKLNWSQSERVINPDSLDSVDNMRYSLSGGGWLNLGYIVRDSSQSLYRNRQADLPEGIEAIHASILQDISSTTILVFQFFLNDDNANAIEQSLRNTYSTYIEKIRGGRSYQDVIHQKELSVKLARESTRSLCTEWVKNNFPGLYASGQYGESFPTCEIIFFKENEPYIEKKSSRKSFLSVMHLAYDFYAWKSPQIKGLFMQITEATDNLVLSGNISGILDDRDLERFGPDDREDQILQWLTHFDQTIGKWVLFVLARTYEKQLGMLRDAYGSLEFSNFDLAASEARILDNKFLNLQRNLTPFIQEVIPLCENKNYFLNEVYEFFPISEHRKREKGLFNGLRETLLMLVLELQKGEEQVNSIANRTAQITSAISNDRLSKTNISLQRGIFWMTLILILLTLFLVASEFQDDLKNIFQYLLELIKRGDIKYR